MKTLSNFIWNHRLLALLPNLGVKTKELLVIFFFALAPGWGLAQEFYKFFGNNRKTTKYNGPIIQREIETRLTYINRRNSAWKVG